MSVVSEQVRLPLRALAMLAGAAVFAFAAGAGATRGGSRDAGLAAGLAAATGLRVDASEVLLEDPGGPGVAGPLVGMRVVFAAREGAGGPRDIWRATVRMTPRGTVLAVGSLANLTRSPLGDDGPLVREGPRVAFATRAFGGVQSATVLDLRGRAGALGDLRRGITNVLETGAWAGVERWDLRLERPVQELSLRMAGAVLTARAGSQAWRADLASHALAPAEGAELVRTQRVAKARLLWCVDTVRSLAWVGPRPVAWLEERVFGVRDVARRWAFRWGALRAGGAAPEVPESDGERASRALVREPGGGGTDPFWPPPRIGAPLGASSRGEGVWTPAGPPWLRRLRDAPPAFYRTWVRLDRERPYAAVVLVAMDMRQLELGMQAGVEDPVPLVGPRGDGRIPRRREVLERVVAGFNGAFKREHGAYGMVVRGRVLLPPRPRAATVATLDDGRVAMGTWGARATLPPGIVSLRQNLDPLVADGVENPARRSLWGFVLGGVEHMPTVRSGLCQDAHGHLFYAWGEETTARLLARAMRLAGCTYGMHLDMNPTHAAFHFLRVDDIATRQTRYQALAPGMGSNGDRFLYYTLKDFFYVTLREPYPEPVRGVAWSAGSLPQPGPAWMPGLFRAEVPSAEDASAAGVGPRSVRLTSLALERVGWRLRAGRDEPVQGVEGATVLGVAEGHRVLGAVELGVAPVGAGRGLMVEGRVVQAFRAGEAWLELGPWGLRLGEGDAVAAAVRDAVGGVAILRDGVVVESVARLRARVALGLGSGRRALLAEGEVGARTLAEVLRDAGARDAIVLDRGDGVAGARWEGVRGAYGSTVLYVLAAEERPRVVRLEGVLE